MPTRRASATWTGPFKGGSGSFSGGSGAIGATYSAGSRFAEENGSNPEELLASAHAACYSMALALGLENAGYPPDRVITDAACTIEKVGDGFKITKMKLVNRTKVSGISDDELHKIAAATKDGCPVSGALAGVDIELDVERV